MMEIIERAFVLNTAGWFLLIILGMCTYTLVSQMMEDNLLALMMTPILMFGAALGQLGVRELGLPLSSDKTVAMGFGMMIGLFCMAVILVTVMWLFQVFRGVMNTAKKV